MSAMLPPITPSLAEELAQLISSARDLQFSRYIFLMAYCAVLYDILITVEQERSLFWNAKWTKGKFLFYLVRYPMVLETPMYMVYILLTNNNAQFCKAETIINAWATLAFLIPLQAIVILRTIALWEQNRKIIILLLASVLAADIVFFVTILRVSLALHNFVSMPIIQPIFGCLGSVPTLPRTITLPAWISMIIFDSVIFTLTFVKGLRSYLSNPTRTPLLTVLIRDGFLYYAVMFGIAIANLLFFFTLDRTHAILSQALIFVVNASCSIIGSRLMLNMRGVANGGNGVHGSSYFNDPDSSRIGLRVLPKTTNDGIESVGPLEWYDDWNKADRRGQLNSAPFP